MAAPPPRRTTLRFSRRAVRAPRRGEFAVAAAHGARASAGALAAQQLTVWESLLCGAVARTVQVVAMYPVDTIKTRVQFSRAASLSALARLRGAVLAGALYRGTAPSLLGQIPYGMVTFGALEYARARLRARFPRLPRWASTAAAATVGDALGSLWLTPSEVIKQKTQAGLYANAGAAVRGIVAAQGVPGFYQGYAASLSRDVPFRIFQFGFFEAWKGWYAAKVRREVTPVENLLIGACAGTSAAALTTPLDVVRTRMMAQTVGAEGAFRSALDCAVRTVAAEGPMAMFRGIAPRCMLIGPSSAIFFLAYEATKGFFRRREERLRAPPPPKVASAAAAPAAVPRASGARRAQRRGGSAAVCARRVRTA